MAKVRAERSFLDKKKNPNSLPVGPRKQQTIPAAKSDSTPNLPIRAQHPIKMADDGNPGVIPTIGTSTRAEAHEIVKHDWIQAVTELGRTIGYKDTRYAQRKLILADALSHLEQLGVGNRATFRPRNLSGAEVIRKIKALVPTQYGIQAGRPRVHDPTIDDEDVYVVKAACLYIQELRKRRADAGASACLNKNGAVLIQAQQQHQQQHHAQKTAQQHKEAAATAKNRALQFRNDQALAKVDKWCDAWLEGKLREDEWATMEQCLALPDVYEDGEVVVGKEPDTSSVKW